MTEVTSSIETLFERVKDYGGTSLELLKLNAISKTSDVASTVVSSLVIFMIVGFAVMIISIGIALWVGVLLGNAYYGFFIVGLAYAIMAALLYAFRSQWIKTPVSNTIIEKLQG